jgi:hypothetical protein
MKSLITAILLAFLLTAPEITFAESQKSNTEAPRRGDGRRL